MLPCFPLNLFPLLRSRLQTGTQVSADRIQTSQARASLDCKGLSKQADHPCLPSSLSPQTTRLPETPVCLRLSTRCPALPWQAILPPERRLCRCATRSLLPAAAGHRGDPLSAVNLRASLGMFSHSDYPQIAKPQHTLSWKTEKQVTQVCKKCRKPQWAWNSRMNGVEHGTESDFSKTLLPCCPVWEQIIAHINWKN